MQVTLMEMNVPHRPAKQACHQPHLLRLVTLSSTILHLAIGDFDLDAFYGPQEAQRVHDFDHQDTEWLFSARLVTTLSPKLFLGATSLAHMRKPVAIRSVRGIFASFLDSFKIQRLVASKLELNGFVH